MSYPVGSNVSFECEQDFTLRGSPVRYCRPNGLWDGETAVCDNGGKHSDCWGRGRGGVGLQPRKAFVGTEPSVLGGSVMFLDRGGMRSVGRTSLTG